MQNNKEAKIKRCERTVDIVSKIGDIRFHSHYDKCDKAAKYNIQYKDGIRSGLITENVCGIHKVATEKNSLILKKYGFDCELKIENIKPNKQ